MHVALVEPCFPINQRQFARGLHEAGVFLTGIGERPREALDEELRSWLNAYVQVQTVVHEGTLLNAVRDISSRLTVDRLEATIEAHVMAAARVREKLSIPGTSVETTFLCRDKPAMKEKLRQAGVATAHSDGVSDADGLRAFAAKEGFPLIVKPRDGAGAAGTYRINSSAELDAVLPELGFEHGASVAVEEFIEGHEAFYDTLCIDGKIEADFVTHYYPGVLEAMRTRWISPIFITTNRADADSYKEVREMGREVIRVLGIETSATHMEWFFGPKGLKFSEIGCRPPGVGAWDLYRAANGFDIYREWANAIGHGRIMSRPSRQFAAGLINLRPDRDGTITGYSGLEEFNERYRELVIDMHLPAPGSRTQPVEAGYMANAWIRMRHPDYDRLREIFQWVGENVRVHAG